MPYWEAYEWWVDDHSFLWETNLDHGTCGGFRTAKHAKLNNFSILILVIIEAAMMT